MNRRKTILTLAIVVPLALLIWFLLPEQPDPQLVKVQQLQEKAFARNSEMPPEQRREAFGELRKEFEKLSPEQRDQMMRENPPPPMRRFQRDVVNYFQLPEDEKIAMLDRHIDQFEAMRRQFDRQRDGGNEEGRPRGPFGNMTEAQRNEFRKRMIDNTSAQQRGMFSEYMKDLAARRQQRGLPPMPFPGG
ncbi:MAG: hypothetical protein DWQ37_21840 [Planctomycetota bacterium]|nr:MAG: hypothetical protein DWQ37_21840 [Planctomycetota bacterium]